MGNGIFTLGVESPTGYHASLFGLHIPPFFPFLQLGWVGVVGGSGAEQHDLHYDGWV